MDPVTSPASTKARSRLKKKSVSTDVSTTSSTSKRRSKHTSDQPKLLQKYIRFSPLLLITALHLVLITRVMNSVNPESWENVLVPSSYLPMLLLIASTTFFASSYLFLNTGRGMRVAFLITSIFFLKFQAVVFTFPVLATLLIGFIFLESIFILKGRKSPRKKG